MADEQTVYFRNEKHTFRAILKKRHYGYFILIGSPTFQYCLEIRYDTNETVAKLIQIKSERECSLIRFLEEGDTVPMIKASLQCVSTLFPSIKQYLFDDGSNIECGTIDLNSTKPPRKRVIPLSLLHLSIATNGMTWYEKHFNATLAQTNKEKYDMCITRYKTADMMPYDTFKRNYFENEKQITELNPYYLSAKTYIEFFNLVPKKKRCELFFNWIPSFIKSFFDGLDISSDWYISIDTMPKVALEILGPELSEGYSGGSISNTTRRNRSKRRKNILRFSNDIGNLSNSAV